MITQRYFLDIVHGNVPVIVPVSQYDSDFTLVFSLYASTGEFTLEEDTTATIRGTKGDGNGYSVDATIDIASAEVTVEGDEQLTAIAGKQLFELTLWKGQKHLSTANFILNVEKAPLDRDTVSSESKIRELYNVEDNAEQIIAAGQQYDAWRAEMATLQETASQAISTAVNAENAAAEVSNDVDVLKETDRETALTLAGKIDDAYVDAGYLYLTSNGAVVAGPIGPFAGGGGGGGGGNNAVLTVTNTTGWLSTTIASGGACPISVTWSSIEDELPTGNGTLRVTVNGTVKASMEISQGEVTTDISGYLSTGSNVVRIQVADVYGNNRTINFSVTVVVLTISSVFDTAKPYTGAITFPYTPTGAVTKTVHFILDGTEIGTQTTAVSGRQMSYPIPSQAHGAHSLRVYFEAEIGGQTVRSNELYFEFISLVQGDNTVIITSSFHQTTAAQYTSIQIPFTVYDPAALTAEVTLSVNGTVLSTQTVDRTEQSYTYRATEAGTLRFVLSAGGVQKAFAVTVTESDIHVEAETEDLVLYLTAQGRSNNEEDPGSWVYKDIRAAFSGFNFVSDGWQKDSEGITVLRVAGSARVTIPYQPFAADFRGTGKTIEIEFATRNVLDYDAVILSCLSGGRGLSLTAQRALLASEQSEISTQYKEDEHIRLSFVAEKRSEDRLLLVYINGIPSGVIQYPADDDFSQVEPVNISIGSGQCALDLYCIRVYDNDLTRHQVLTNWIADTQVGATLVDRYTRNDIYDAYGAVVIAKLPNDLPYMILEAEQLPQYKGDKKTISGSYTDPQYPSKSFTFTGCQINVQGTSSAPYARKNYDLQFKAGFEMSYGHRDTYALAGDVIPFNRFVLKADVASSEGANNVELVKLFNDITPFKTAEQEEDPRVRQGIYGFPIVVFWSDGENTTFLGKYNFNLPKRAGKPYGYSGEMESWEFQNNTSSLMVFQSDYFDETMYTDPDTGETKERWRFDYEARFPADTWTNYAKLQELQSFIYSTYRAEATGAALPAPITYDEVEYTADTADYRLARFKAEFPSYAELDSFVFYYLFTELFLMVDSRAKNLFIGFNGSPVTEPGRAADRKAVAQPYDMDTGLGTNNEGSLVFGYSLEDTDHLAGGANVFNGQHSVLWCNLRDAFPAEIVRMYQTLRASLLSYGTVEQRYEDHQAKWPEAIWAEDAWFKYIDPLIAPDPGKEATAVYLPMMQGSKTEQRKWWLSNRFRYMDSKWNAGDALAHVIQLRGYAKADITVTPYADIYPTVKYASYLVQARGARGTATTLACPLDSVNDTEIYIYSAPQLADVGDLSGLKVGFADFSAGTRLQTVKVGDAAQDYDNPNLNNLTLGSNRLLRRLDARNCSALGTGDQKTVDLSGCEIIEEIYLDGTRIQGVTLPNGGVLRVLHLPATVTNLTLMNQTALTDLTIPSYANISTLRIENGSSAIDSKAMVQTIPAAARVRLIGIAWSVASKTELESLFDTLDTMRGLDEHGNNVDTAQVSGTIHVTGTITGDDIAAWKARYPYINYTADSIAMTLSYYNYDGTSLITTELVSDGGDGTYAGRPSRDSTAQYTYAFAGWATEPNGAADANATKMVTTNRSVYAAYTATLRTYTVTWKNGSTTLETDTNVPYGATPSYDGATPTSTEGDFQGWQPTIAPVTGNITYTAYFAIPEPEHTITDTWEEIFQHIAVGDYATRYSVGDTMSLNLGSEGYINMQIVAFDTDELADGSGKAPITWISEHLLKTTPRMNPAYSDGQEGTGMLGGWVKSELRSYMKTTIKTLVPEIVKNEVKEVIKYTGSCDVSSGSLIKNVSSTEDVWIPSNYEMSGNEFSENTGAKYTEFFPSDSSRIKRPINQPTENRAWFLRSAFSKTNSYVIGPNGRVSNSYAKTNMSLWVALGFCT